MDLSTSIPNLQIDLKYFGPDNFTGTPIPGYGARKALLSERAASALARAQQEASSFGLSLHLFDAYRPQRAVDYFRAWSSGKVGFDTQEHYYPNARRADLFELGYLARHSTHSRASTVDLTLADADTAQTLDMGTTFDLFDTRSHTHGEGIAPQQRANRLLLCLIMEKAGFENYWMEWWHFTLRDEPYTDRYFDFMIA